MGYELHITRKEEWHDDIPECDITLQEWLDYVATDKELTVEVSHNSNGWILWMSHPERKGNPDSAPPFTHSHGCIIVKNPDDYIIAKMITIANKLNAKVQGDDGEIYDASYLVAQATKKETRPWWKFW